jgi:heme o synthase
MCRPSLDGGLPMQSSSAQLKTIASDGTRSVPATMSVYWRLIRPGLLLTVLFAMAAAAWAAPQPPPWSQLAHALLGAGLLIGGASAMNQLAERRRDLQMARTASRPLPSGCATVRQAAVFAALCSLTGIGYLAALQPPVLTLLAALSWGIYVLLYTPLKRHSVWHVPVGAVAGALPALMGAAAADVVFAPVPLAIFGVVFFWQFPHTAAIGWIYRAEYARGDVKVAAVADPSGRLAGWFALAGAAALLPVSLIPSLLAAAGWPYAVIALALGTVDLSVAGNFLRRPTDAHARWLWRVSLIHLPMLLTALLLTALQRL